MKYSTSSGMNVMPTFLTGEGAPRLHKMMFCNLSAILAIYSIGIAIVFQPFQASIIIGKVLHELLESIFFHWRFVIFLCHFVPTLTAFIYAYIIAQIVPTVKGYLPKSINEYINRIIPRLKNYRHKVAAHFALTAPKKEDNVADLLSSVMTNVIYAHGYLRAGAISEIIYDENGKEIKQKTRTSWSLTKTHENLIPRYWPNGPEKSFPSIKISAKTTRKFFIDWGD